MTLLTLTHVTSLIDLYCDGASTQLRPRKHRLRVRPRNRNSSLQLAREIRVLNAICLGSTSRPLVKHTNHTNHAFPHLTKLSNAPKRRPYPASLPLIFLLSYIQPPRSPTTTPSAQISQRCYTIFSWKWRYKSINFGHSSAIGII